MVRYCFLGHIHSYSLYYKYAALQSTACSLPSLIVMAPLIRDANEYPSSPLARRHLLTAIPLMIGRNSAGDVESKKSPLTLLM